MGGRPRRCPGTEQRVAALDFPDDPHPHAVQGLGELPPLDSRRRAENEAWLAFTARVMSAPSCGPCATRRTTLSARSVTAGWPVSSPRVPGADASWPAARLHALLDGLAVHGAMRPEVDTPWSPSIPRRPAACSTSSHGCR
ncbi:TetR family transcriptional regulator C-terminal domain-containing protein [Streptomyces sp. NPDC058268]|uniref:TetR family transcriptional regulator C-terminal domain-containing protein n=1 Tax=Streptomyces sp. NPDC058268 TaxID=3346413 RepID=UPI0036E95DD6